MVACGDGLGPGCWWGWWWRVWLECPCPLTISRGVVRHGIRPAVPAFAIATTESPASESPAGARRPAWGARSGAEDGWAVPGVTGSSSRDRGSSASADSGAPASGQSSRDRGPSASGRGSSGSRAAGFPVTVAVAVVAVVVVAGRRMLILLRC